MFAFLTPTVREAAVRREHDLLRAQLHALMRICREQVGPRPLPFTDAERRHISEQAHACGWRARRLDRKPIPRTARSIHQTHAP